MPGVALLPCGGPVYGHELKKRSRGGSITDVDNIALACWAHNRWAEDYPTAANQIGWAQHTWAVKE